MIDDDPGVGAALQPALETAHHNVFLASDGKTGVEQFRAVQPDLVFCDLAMPNQNGWDTLRELKAIAPGVPVLLMSDSRFAPEALRAAALALGARSFLEKPLSPAAAVAAVETMLSAKAQGCRRILVVDDEADVRVLLERALRRAGHEVAVAADGLEALKSYRAHPADVVIADLFMPVMDGIETIRELRREFPEAKVIGMSGNAAGSNLLSAARQLGSVASLEKPFTLDQLLEVVQKAWATSRTAGATPSSP